MIRKNNFCLIKRLFIVCSFYVVTSKADLNILKKSDWLGEEPAQELDDLTTPVGRVVISHTSGADCSDQESCSQSVRALQTFHMESFNFSDIGYNFLVGNDGNVYEGRGWDKMGAFAKGFNSGSIGIALIGTFEKVLPNAKALDAVKELIAEGVTLEKIAENYKLLGHRQLSATISPGTALYNEIRTWPQWSRRV